MKIISNHHNILSIEAKIFDLSGLIDNEKLKESILENSHLRLSDNPADTRYEDSQIPITKEYKKLLAYVNQIIENVSPGILNYVQKNSIHKPWAHICNPGQSTVVHSHSGYYDEFSSWSNSLLSWCYYVNMPTNGGNLAFSLCLPFFKEYHFEVIPKTGGLIVFPGWINHLTKVNASDEKRISIAGNFFLPPNYLDNLSQEKLKILTEFMCAPSIDINRLTIKM